MGDILNKRSPEEWKEFVMEKGGVTEESYNRKREVFNHYKDGEDKISLRGLEKMVKKNNPRRGKSILEIAPLLYEAYDRDNDSVISFRDYILIETVFASEDLEAAVGLIFDVIDVDKSGYLDRDELTFIVKIMHKSLLTKLMTKEEIVDQLFKVKINTFKS